jgi:hypothetical protein
MARIRLPLALVATALAAGCAAPGPYPSLAVRPAEREHAADAEERRPAPLPDDSDVAREIGRLAASAREGAAEFDRAARTAEARAARAGGRGSDSWVEAQQAVSRAEAARAATTRALAELDALALARAAAGGTSVGDLERLRAAIAEVQALADSQSERLRRLQRALS